MEDDAYEFLKENLLSWKNLSNNEIKSEALPFCNSRKVFKVSLIEDSCKIIEPDVVLLRQWTSYSGLTPKDKEKESLVFRKLAELGLGPKFYGQNEKYRIEEYIKNSRSIKNSEINHVKVRRCLAIRLAKLHSTKNLVKPELVAANFIINLLDNQVFMDRARNNCAKCVDGTNDELFNDILKLFNKDGLDFIRKIVNSEECTSSHNDIWCGNLLVQLNKDDSIIPNNVLYIDYETFGFNFPGYDIGKLLAENMYEFEACGHKYKLRHDLYPSKEDVYDFLKFYMLSFDNHPKTVNDDVVKDFISFDTTKIDQELVSFYITEEEVYKKLSFWWNQSRKGAIVSAFYSTLLGFWIGKNDNYQTDFIKFGTDGFSIYNRFKNDYITF